MVWVPSPNSPAQVFQIFVNVPSHCFSLLHLPPFSSSASSASKMYPQSDLFYSNIAPMFQDIIISYPLPCSIYPHTAVSSSQIICPCLLKASEQLPVAVSVRGRPCYRLMIRPRLSSPLLSACPAAPTRQHLFS